MMIKTITIKAKKIVVQKIVTIIKKEKLVVVIIAKIEEIVIMEAPLKEKIKIKIIIIEVIEIIMTVIIGTQKLKKFGQKRNQIQVQIKIQNLRTQMMMDFHKKILLQNV